MKTIRTLIVDDEPLARKTIRLLLEHDTEVEVIGECRNGMEAATTIAGKKPDLVFLDIQMPRMNGFEVIDAVGPGNMPGIVFVTAYDSYALKAFDSHALDYLLKPFNDDRFHSALRRAKEIIRGEGLGEFSRRLEALGKNRRLSKRFLTKLLVRSGPRSVLLDVHDISWIRSADYCVEIHTHSAKYVHRESLTSLATRLDPSKFFRSHRSAIINLDYVAELRPTHRGDHVIFLKGGKKVKLSRTRRKALFGLIS